MDLIVLYDLDHGDDRGCPGWVESAESMLPGSDPPCPHWHA
jgi:hypothetical protein